MISPEHRCCPTDQDLREWVYGESTWEIADRPALEKHLQDCTKCQAARDDLLMRRAQSLLGVGSRSHGLANGDRVGQYTIRGALGEGGFGLVYLAVQDPPSRQNVALKILRDDQRGEQVLARFRQEQQAQASLSHASVAKIFGSGKTPTGRPYFVMEYVDGRPITEFCEAEGSSVEERLTLFLQVCEGVQHAHNKGIIHRDLKPSNVLVAKSEDSAVAKVIDFGVAKVRDPAVASVFTEYRQFLGTLNYMAPEQTVSARDADVRSDVYALGAILYELLTGHVPLGPFEGSSRENAAKIIQECRPERASARVRRERSSSDHRVAPSDSDPNHPASKSAAQRHSSRGASALERRLSSGLDDIVDWCLRKEPGERCPTVRQLADDVRAFLENLPIKARPYSAMYELKLLFRRNRGRVYTTLLVLVLACTSVVLVVATLDARRRTLGFESRQLVEEAESAHWFGDTERGDALLRRALELDATNARAVLESSVFGQPIDSVDARTAALRLAGSDPQNIEVCYALELLDPTDSTWRAEGDRRAHAAQRLDAAATRAWVHSRMMADDSAEQLAILDQSLEQFDAWDHATRWERARLRYLEARAIQDSKPGSADEFSAAVTRAVELFDGASSDAEKLLRTPEGRSRLRVWDLRGRCLLALGDSSALESVCEEFERRPETTSDRAAQFRNRLLDEAIVRATNTMSFAAYGSELGEDAYEDCRFLLELASSSWAYAETRAASEGGDRSTQLSWIESEIDKKLRKVGGSPAKLRIDRALLELEAGRYRDALLQVERAIEIDAVWEEALGPFSALAGDTRVDVIERRIDTAGFMENLFGWIVTKGEHDELAKRCMAACLSRDSPAWCEQYASMLRLIRANDTPGLRAFELGDADEEQSLGALLKGIYLHAHDIEESRRWFERAEHLGPRSYEYHLARWWASRDPARKSEPR